MAASPKPITIIITDQYPVVRYGLREVFKRHPAMRVVGEAENGRAAVRLAMSLKPDVLITDIPMPRMNGIESVRQILARRPETRVIILSALHLDYQIRDAINAGVHGFMVKSADINELPAMVKQVAAGGTSFSPEVARYIQQHGDCPKDHASGLTSRERQVVQLVGEGMQNKEIAQEMEISLPTADDYVKAIIKKLNVQNRAGVVRYAIETRICELSF